MNLGDDAANTIFTAERVMFRMFYTSVKEWVERHKMPYAIRAKHVEELLESLDE